MTQDEALKLAQECGLIGMRPHLDGIYSEALVAFAKLVAQHEREWFLGYIQEHQPSCEQMSRAIKARGQA